MERHDILIIMDRSGSMASRKADHEGGLRSFVQDVLRLDRVEVSVLPFRRTAA